MKDNIEFYIEFIAEVEKNPQLYDHVLADYSNRRTTEVIWAKIGEKFNETGKYLLKSLYFLYCVVILPLHQSIWFCEIIT